MSIRNHFRSPRSVSPALLSVGLLLAAGPAFSAEWVEADVPFDRASVRAAALAPSQPARMFVAGPGGPLYRSEDAGATWTNISAHVPPGSNWGEIAISPGDPDLVLAGVSGPLPDGPAVVLRSLDGGDTWAAVSSGLGGRRVGPIAFDPVNPNRAFAGTSSGTEGGVYRTEDGGGTWARTTTSFGHLDVLDLAVDPSDPSRILASTLDGYLRSTDGGNSWDLVSPGYVFTAISWSSTDPSVVYGADQNDALISTDGGVSFVPLATPSEAYAFDVIAVDPSNEDRVFLSGQAPCEFGFFDTGALYRSVNGGTSWTRVFASEDCSDFAELVFFDPSVSATMYLAGSGPAGFWRSTNSGTTWSPRNAGIHMYSVDDLDVDGAEAVYARAGDVSLRAGDISLPWTELPLPFYSEARAFEASPTVPGLLYESGIGYVIDQGWPYLMVSENAGQTWNPGLTEVPAGVPFDYALCLAAASNSSRIFAFLFDGVYRSEDRSQSYVQVHSGTLFWAAAVHPTDPDRVAGARAQDPSFQLSTDGGVTWMARSTGLPLDLPVMVEFDPSDPDRIAVVFEDEGVYETSDAGLNWAAVFDANSRIRDADWDPVTGYFYVATQSDGVLSDDPRFDPNGLPSVGANAVLHLDGEDAVVAGTSFNGIYAQFLDDPASVDPSVSAPAGATIELEVYPNPSRGEARIDLRSVGETGSQYGRLTVHDAAGRQVRTLYQGNVDVNGHGVSWDGRDSRGVEVTAGIYWVRFEGEGQARAVAQVTLVR